MASPISLELNDELKGREEKRETLRQETLNVWDEFQATGLHLTGDEVEKWLSTWGADEELPRPECHK
ncbi:transcriptional regulator [Rhizobium chutanense]|uniref:Transcriptional regulator n=1 Tax=Rhizobium chutanense TaxID=2035448 RepID=A0A2A6J8E9_9HYPH|nr:transcriptional regulator [Rhizobium chutanense]PDT02509.1 transcriptional regulator [Rhizobium chutanense]